MIGETVEANLEYNRRVWGDAANWIDRDKYGYQWSGGLKQAASDISRFADAFLKPYTNGRYDHRVLEVSPGAGRFTAELIRYAARLDLLDMNHACLDICKERFKYYPLEIDFLHNDGQSCDILRERSYSLIASFDSMVHMHPDIIEGYICQLAPRLEPNGIMWLDHSGKGARSVGHRTDMTAGKMKAIGKACGLILLEQKYRNDHDCVSVFIQ